MQIGYIGLGKMGKNMVLHLVEQGVKVVAWNRSQGPREEVAKAGAKAVPTLEDLVDILKPPRVIWIMLTAGEAVDMILDQLVKSVSKGDLLIDGGNSYYKDTLRRAKMLQTKGIHYMDIGTSGGPSGARSGACLMIGGTQEDYKKVLPLVKATAAPKAYGHFGPVGAGHFAKMVHNGIEYGMMEAIAEGAAVLKTAGVKLFHPKGGKLDLAEVFRVYNNRSVIESRLIDWTQQALSEDPKLSNISSVIGHTGEGEWTIKTAQELKVEVPVIEDSLKVRLESEAIVENSPQGYRNKIVSAMRGKFGSHAVKKAS